MHRAEDDISFSSLFAPFTTGKAIIYLLLIGCIVYGNVLVNGFVGDDHGQIVDNPLVHSITHFPQFFQGSTLYLPEVGQSVGLYYRPVMSLVFSLIYTVAGPTPFFFHLVQLTLHLTNCVLIFLIFKKMFGRNLAFILGLIFLLHPINNEAVVYISNMQEELFAFFGLLALTCLGTKKWYLSIPVLLLLSLLSKESGILFIPLVLLYYVLFEKRSIQRTRYLLFSTGGVILFYLLLRIFIGNTGLQTKFLYMASHATFLERLYTLPSILLYYEKLIFFPVDIAFGWYWVINHPTFSNFGLPLLVVSISLFIILIPLYLLRKKIDLRNKYFFFLSTFFISVALISQVFPLDLTVADRWFYLPLFGLLGMLGVLLKTYHMKLQIIPHGKQVGIVFVTGILILFSVITISRTTNWSSNYALCLHDVAINTQSYILEYCASNELYNRGAYTKADIHAQKAIQLYPGYFLSWYTKGKIQYALGNRIQAKEAFEKTMTLNDFGVGSQELALILVYEKKPKEAKQIAEKYLKTNPNSGQLWYALALAYYLEGNHPAAVNAAKNAYRLQPTPLTQKVYTRLEKNLPITF